MKESKLSGIARGFSLIEMTIYMFLLILVLGAVFKLVVINRRQMERPAATFRIQQGLLAAHKWLQRDLEDTRLHTVRVYPTYQIANEPPGLSMLSPRDENGNIKTEAGLPVWQKTIYYTLRPNNDPNNPNTARLVRIEEKLATPTTEPTASETLPSTVSSTGKSWVISNSILKPGADFRPELPLQLDNRGGFDVFFTDAGETQKYIYYLPVNKAPLVTVHLMAGERSRATGKLTVLNYEIRVCPRN